MLINYIDLGIKLGAKLIKELDKKFKKVETEVKDAFNKLEAQE